MIAKFYRKWFILAILFLLPVVFLLFLYPSTHNYNTLDIVGEDINEFHFWVVRSHQIEYKYAAKFGDNLLIKTYVTKTNTFLSERIVEIILEPDEKIITRCITKWCYVNRENRKLEKIPKKIKDLLQSKD